ncbi:MAG: Rieske 2Fe-2S domain-containing protein [Candidatus Planktophila sp.]|nr:Rieske 2Fe-2S domain-containing protein [Candidatus Planktophila sp.]
MNLRFFRAAAASWQSQLWPTRIIRFWLGFTWLFAAWNKATDPGFLKAGSTTFIGTQLTGYSTQSPIGFVLERLIENSVQVGIFVMISEFAIGLATIFWVVPTMAAFGGFSMSVGLWLASSFYVDPYFLASDTAYAVLWLSYLLLIKNNRKGFAMSLERRGVMRVGIIGTLAIAFAGVGKFFTPNSNQDNASAATKVRIVKLTALKVGATKNFALANGAPAILFRTKTGVFAYSAICTHQGCTVSYFPSSKTLKCPCHGSKFDPFKSANVIAGPATSKLPSVKVVIEGAWVVLV